MLQSLKVTVSKPKQNSTMPLVRSPVSHFYFVVTLAIRACMGGDLVPSLGGRNKILRTKFSNDPFKGKNFHFLRILVRD